MLGLSRHSIAAQSLRKSWIDPPGQVLIIFYRKSGNGSKALQSEAGVGGFAVALCFLPGMMGVLRFHVSHTEICLLTFCAKFGLSCWGVHVYIKSFILPHLSFLELGTEGVIGLI